MGPIVTLKGDECGWCKRECDSTTLTVRKVDDDGKAVEARTHEEEIEWFHGRDLRGLCSDCMFDMCIKMFGEPEESVSERFRECSGSGPSLRHDFHVYIDCNDEEWLAQQAENAAESD